MNNIVIAIDGPSGVGKSTTARRVAEALQYRYLDTGAMYRAIALKVIHEKVSFTEIEKITALLATTAIELSCDNDGMHLFLDGKEVTQEIRTPEISQAASIISAVPTVRAKLVEEQQRLGKDGGVVVEGRDIGTVVYPHAALKIFMTASAMHRAERRKSELQSAESSIPLNKLMEQMKERDERDSTREHSPLTKADDAITLDTSDMTIEEQVSFIVNEAKKRIILS
ncbi:MAG: (d)CMP kinase [Bacteroidota bacterium]